MAKKTVEKRESVVNPPAVTVEPKKRESRRMLDAVKFSSLKAGQRFNVTEKVGKKLIVATFEKDVVVLVDAGTKPALEAALKAGVAVKTKVPDPNWEPGTEGK